MSARSEQTDLNDAVCLLSPCTVSSGLMIEYSRLYNFSKQSARPLQRLVSLDHELLRFEPFTMSAQTPRDVLSVRELLILFHFRTQDRGLAHVEVCSDTSMRGSSLASVQLELNRSLRI